MNLLIIGAGGHGKCCYEIASRMNCFDKIDFVDDGADEIQVLNKKVAGKQSNLSDLRENYDSAFVAIGNNLIRKQITEELKQLGFQLVNLIDPSAVVSQYCKLGEGIVVFPNATVEIESDIGSGVIISSNSVVHHNAVVEDFVLIYANCVVRPVVTIKELTVLKSGSIVES